MLDQDSDCYFNSYDLHLIKETGARGLGGTGNKEEILAAG